MEKRAAERYADITPEDRARQRERGWGLPIDTAVPEQAPPPGFATSPMSAQLAPQRLGETSLSLYEFGSRFIPHSSTPIRCLLPLLEDRYLLIGSDDGLGMLDVFPESESLALENGSVLHALEAAKRRDVWTGESIYQLNLLECYPDNQGGLQGVVLALVGPEESDPEKEPMRSVRMYNLASIFSLVKWTAAHPDAKPPVIHGPKGWSPQQAGTRRLQRPSAHAITKSLKSMVIDHGRPDTPPGSMSSVKASSFASERSPPKHQDSADTADSWDLVDDLPLRWATDYVNLATAGSKLSNTPVLFYELWRNDGVNSRGTSMLAVVTKTAILLYETPRGERSFRFVKEFYTPLPAKLVTFVQQTNNDIVRAVSVHHEGGERLRKERPLSRGGPEGVASATPRARRQSIPGDSTYGSQLSLFVIFEKKAGLIRIADSAVSEMELWDDGGRPPSPIRAQSPTSIHSIHSSSGFRKSIQVLDFHRDGRGMWQPMITMDIPYPPSANGEQSVMALSKTFLIISRGSQTHILPSPLRMPLANHQPLRVIRWHTPPSRVSARVSLLADRPAMLQLVAFSDKGIEIAETPVTFLFQQSDPGSPGKGKGKGKSISAQSEPLNRAQWHTMETTKPLCRGGIWHRLDTSSGRPEIHPSEWANDLASHPAATSKLETGKGIYATVQRGLDDYRVIWLGDDVSPGSI